MKNFYFFILLFFSYCICFAQDFGQFASGIRINGSIYNTTGDIGITPFQDANLGTFGANSPCAKITAGEIKTWKNISANVCGAKIYWRVYPTSASPSGSFNFIILPFGSNCSSGVFADGVGTCNTGDQKWKDYSLNIDFISGLGPNNYILEIYYEYTGSNSSTSTCEATKFISNFGSNFKANFTITSPTISCPANITQNIDSGLCSASIVTQNPTIGDNCFINKLTWELTGATTGISPATGINYLGTQVFNKGITTVTYIASDAAGNSASCSFTVSVVDNQPPTIATLAAITVNADSGICTYASSQLPAPTASDNCTTVTVTRSPATLSKGTNTVTWTATDGAGLTATSTQTVTVVDNQAPTIATLAAITVNADSGVCTYASSQLTPPTASDNCTTVTVTRSPATLSKGTNTVTWTATDGAGLTATSTQTVTVVDNQPPTIATLAAITVNADSGICTYASSQLTAPTAADNCTTVTITRSPATLSKGTNTVTWTATDGAGLTATSTQTVTVVDNQPPTIATLAATTVNADSGICTYASSQLTAPTAADNCTTVTITRSPATLSKGTNTVTWTATDGAGLTATSTQTVTVVDNQPPTIATLAAITVNADSGVCTYASSQLTSPTASDNCTTVTVTRSPATLSKGTNTVTWTATDGAGLTATSTQTVTVVDNQPPTIATLAAITVNADSGVCTYASSQLTAPTAADNCTTVTVTRSPATLSKGTNTVTWTATDGAGLTATSTQTVTVVDNQPPTIATLAAITVNADSGVCTYASSQLTAPTASDNCTTVTVTRSPATLSKGTNTVTWTATDGAGLTATSTQTVTVVDNQAPTIATLAAITVNADPGICTYASSQLTPPTASDNCTTVTVTRSPATLSKGTNTVTWTATDGANLTATSTQTVTVVDNQAPTIATLAATTVNADSGICTYASSQLTAPTAADNCTTVTITRSPATLSKGTNTVTWTATDGAGLTATSTQTVTVVDNQPPTIATLAAITVNADSGVCTYASSQLTAPTAADNCTTVTVTRSPATLSKGTNTVTWTATDGAGLTATSTQTVTVVDNQPPTIATLAAITVNADSGVCTYASSQLTPPTASDNCTTVTVTRSPATLSKGTNTVTWTATDGAGLTATSTQTVTVVDNQPPTIATLAAITVNADSGVCTYASSQLTSPTASDNCTTVTVTRSPATLSKGTNTVTWTATDGAGLTATSTQTVTVVDNQPPTIATLAAITVNADSGVCTYASSQLTSPTASDNCTTVTVTRSPATLSKGTNTVTWTATDGAGLTATSTQTVTVVDNQPPTIATLTDITVNADPGVCTYASSQLTAPTAADNCTTVTVTRSPATLSKGTNTVTWTATDGASLIATSTQTVTVVDNQPPTAICKNISVSLNALGTASITAADINNNSTDNCGIASLVASKTTFNCANLGTNSVTLTVTDTSGNVNSCTSTVTVVDAIAPVALCKPFTLNLDVAGNATLLATDINNGSSDNCSFTRTISKANFDCSNIGANTVTLTITDAAGNSSSCNATVTVQSSLAITATSNSVVCAGNTLKLFGNITSGAFGTPTYSWVGPLGFSSTSQNPSIPNVSMGAAGTYTLTVINGNGCTASQTTTVLVNPVPNVSINPSFASGFVKKFTGSLVLYTYTVTNVGLVSDSFNLSYIADSDPMDVTMDVRFLTMGGAVITSTPMISAGGNYTFQLELSVQGNQPRVYNHTVLIATSNLCSNSSVSADAYTYEYNGNQPPADNGSQLEISKVAIDNTTGVDITNAIVGVPFKYKITVVNNSNGDDATNVVINDLVPASLSITDNGGGIQTGNSIRWNVGSLTKKRAGQNTVQKIITVVPSCSSLLSVSNTANVISSPPDNGQGIGAATVITNITDNIPPTANCKPITVYLNSAGVATITESMINNGSTDNCSIQSVTIDKSTFNCSNLGANNVILTVKDISGNSATCTSIVTVVDNLAPVFTSCPTNPASLCADNATSYTKVGTSWNALATDNCTFSLVYTLSGSTTGTGTSLNGVAFNVGTTTVTWKATDSAGNVSNCIFTVTINGLPIITTQPITELECEGNIVTFKALASGSGLTYVWQRKLPAEAVFSTIPAEGNVSYPSPGEIRLQNVGSVMSPSGTQYQVIITNSNGCSITSSVATLLVNEVTGISPSATNVTQCYGTNYSYTVSTSAPPPGSVVSYQWKSSVASGVWNPVVDGVHYSGATTATLNILNGTPAQSAAYKVQVIFTSSASTCTVTTALTRQITFLPEVTPPVAAITQPDCFTATGSILLSGLPAIGTWTLTRTGTSGATTTGTGFSTTISGLTAGTYNFTVSNGTCTSLPSANVVINVQPGTPLRPTIVSYTLPTFADNDGTITLGDLPSGNWVLNQIKNGVTTTISGSGSPYTLTGLSNGNYEFEVVALCTSPRSQLTPLTPIPYNPLVSPATDLNCTGFTANWPATFAATAYLLDVSTVSNFASFISGYQDRNVGNVLSFVVSGMPTGPLYYRIRAKNATLITLYSATITVTPLINTYSAGSWSLGTPPPTIGTQNLVFNTGFTATADLAGCSCTVNSGNVIVNSGITVTLNNEVKVLGGSLTFEDSSSLVQINNVANTGNITYKRNTTRITRMDYTYWSTPVMPHTLGSVSPNTSVDKYYSFNSNLNDWKQESAATAMVPGVGYIIRGPQNFTINNPAFYEAPFVGVPNNGPYAVSGIIADRSYLLGNPYPSALDADAFLDTNQNVLDGTLYFWTHNTPIAVGTPDPGTGVYAYSGNDYASYNRTGGVSTKAQAPSSLTPFTGINDNIPSGKIASGQGFFGGSKVTLPSGPMIVYDNSMRVGVGTITGNNSQFYKTKNPKAKIYVLEKHRIWLDLTNTQGAFKQTLVGYVTEATNDYEGRFDGESYDGNDFLDFYSILQDKNLTIQGRALPFDQNDEIPLGYRVAVGGTFSVAIGQVDGLLLNQPVFIEDKLNNTIHNLKGGKYTFTTDAGTFDDRFVLRYTDKTLGIDEVVVNDGIIALYSNNYKTLIIRNTLQDATVNSVTLYSLSGQKISSWDVKGREQTSIQIPIKNLPTEIYVVKIKTTQGDFSKKIIVK
ncbi:HYR domain-containing protein [Flavobacterium nackdongense]|uniref:HYR domain-containing protein n=1 Tax=Flavobacterium nackdongense TaxID=2547394 RepID=A0A4V1AGT3_9FLAO|nr:HYR domain-containing protein [Flavobacterium nackdongense]QBN19142.1 HYR domain-containing protein [Flavobacterium nackdongense]